MTINFTVREAVRALPALEQLAARDLPQKAAWRLGRVIDHLEPIVRRYTKHSNALITKYGEKNTKGALEVTPTNPKYAEWETEHEALLDATESIAYDPIPLALFKRKKVALDGDDNEKEAEVDIEMNGAYLGRCIKFFKEDDAPARPAREPKSK